MDNLIWEIAGMSACGPVRAQNEDAIDFDQEHGIMVLADGLGGHNAGEVASAMVVRRVGAQLRAAVEEGVFADGRLLCERLKQAGERANAEVHAAGQEDPARAGMGSTMVAAVIRGLTLYLAHVGDSRAYLLRDGALQVVTHDHTMLQEAIELGLVKEPYPGAVKRRSLLTRAIGTAEEVEVDTQTVELRATDVVMIASDGLFEPVPDADMAATLGKPVPLQDIATELIDLAIKLDSDDNLSVILARMNDRARQEQ
ncbi:MAG TPA: protein phosphatase 2C domain-containing protein [Noviherbaspirillum sp.]|nr:protein phosphatase 2C domain-containing protein [Noviherbaspirillum sp.]